MRNLFFVFLSANFFIFMFYYYLPEDKGQQQASIPVGTKQLVLLSEVDKAALTQQNEVEPVDVEQPKAAKVKPVVKKCFTIGPFRDEKEISGFDTQIRGRVKQTSVRERTEKQHWRYWVYLSVVSTRAKAVKLASELAKKGLKDYYVIARGEFKNAVSLGHFIDKSLAENRFALIEKMGYKPKMKAIEKEFTLYWLDYQSKDGQGLSNHVLNSFELDESIRQFNRECGK